MGFFENIYCDQGDFKDASKKSKQSAKDLELVEQYNHNVDIVQDIISEIKAVSKQRHPDTCDWITIDGIRYASWIINEWGRGYDRICITFLSSDGRLAVRGISSEKNRIVDLRHISDINEQTTNSTVLSYFNLDQLRKYIIDMAKNSFKITPKEAWMEDKILRQKTLND